jgi:hypothetical protein
MKPPGGDEYGRGKKRRYPWQQRPGFAVEVIKDKRRGLRIDVLELAGGQLERIGHCPAADNAIESQRQDCAHAAEKDTHPAPVAGASRFPGNGLDCGRRSGRAAPADHELSHEHGQRQHDDGRKVDKHERATAADACRVGKQPDIAETDGAADGCHDERES